MHLRKTEVNYSDLDSAYKILMAQLCDLASIYCSSKTDTAVALQRFIPHKENKVWKKEERNRSDFLCSYGSYGEAFEAKRVN